MNQHDELLMPDHPHGEERTLDAGKQNQGLSLVQQRKDTSMTTANHQQPSPGATRCAHRTKGKQEQEVAA